MKNYIEKDSFIKTRNMILNDLKKDFMQYLLEKYEKMSPCFKRDGKTKEIVFKAGELTDADGNFPTEVFASIDLHVKNYIDTKISGKEIPAYDFDEEVENYYRVMNEKEEEKKRKKAEKQAKIERDRAAREKRKKEIKK